MTMVLDILFNRITGHFIPNRLYKIPIIPKLPSLQFPLHFRMPSKYLLRTHALQYSHHVPNTILQRDTRKYIYMILSYFHLNNLIIPGAQYLPKQFVHYCSCLIPSNPFSLLGRLHEMISGIINRVAQMPQLMQKNL